MKYFSIFLFYAVIITHNYEQAAAQNYYPLHVGNQWIYDHYYWPSTYDTTRIKVIGDSILPNGLNYFVLNAGDVCRGNYIRIDSDFVCYYNEFDSVDAPFLKLNAIEDETWDVQFGTFMHVTLTSIDTISLFGTDTKVLTFVLDGLEMTTVKLSDKFGPITVLNWGDPPSPIPYETCDIIGCVLSDTSYGYTIDVAGESNSPHHFMLYQNYPNPFNPETDISYYLSVSQRIKINIYNSLGQHICTLVDLLQNKGYHHIRWNGKNKHGNMVSSGVYIYTLELDNNQRISKKMLLLK